MLDNSKSQIVAAFDFDGTLTHRDSLLPFLFFVKGAPVTLFKLLIALPVLIAYLFKIRSRQEAKEYILTSFFSGMTIDELKLKGRKFAQNGLCGMVIPERMKRLRWHQQEGHKTILISASVDVYLRPWSESVGFDHLISSELEVDAQGRVTGKLKGLNCWGPEKTRRLEQLLGSKEGYQLYAYGDSRGDRELLSLADYPFYREFEPKCDSCR